MKIELEEPFKSKWKFGVLQTHKDGRKRVRLYGENFIGNTIISYARYLMTIKLGYFISDELVVDHKDNDKTNDDINNLQLLTWSKNIKKEHQRYIDEVQIKHKLICACCKKSFIIIDRIKKMKLAQNVTDWFCSKSCSTKYHYHNGS